MNARRKQTGVARAAVLLVAGATATVGAQEPPIAAKSCVYLPDVDHTKIVDNRNILFYLHNNTVLRNSFREPCFGLHEKSRFTYGSNSMKRLCGGDMITLIADLSFGGVAAANTCKLGMFLPLNEDEVDDLLAAAGKGRGAQKKQAIKSQPVELHRDATRDLSPEAPPAERATPGAPAPTPAQDGEAR